jgi:hypothetical protein
MVEEATEHISDDDEEVRGQGVPLAEAVTTIDPSPWSAVE